MSRDRKVTSLSSVRVPTTAPGKRASDEGAIALLARIVAAQGEGAAIGGGEGGDRGRGAGAAGCRRCHHLPRTGADGFGGRGA